MTKEQEESIERINNDIAKPLYCGDITICNIDDLKTILSMLEEKDKVIDLMAEIIMEDENLLCEFDFEEWKSNEEVKQYFENKVKER